MFRSTWLVHIVVTSLMFWTAMRSVPVNSGRPVTARLGIAVLLYRNAVANRGAEGVADGRGIDVPAVVENCGQSSVFSTRTIAPGQIVNRRLHSQMVPLADSERGEQFGLLVDGRENVDVAQLGVDDLESLELLLFLRTNVQISSISTCSKCRLVMFSSRNSRQAFPKRTSRRMIAFRLTPVIRSVERIEFPSTSNFRTASCFSRFMTLAIGFVLTVWDESATIQLLGWNRAETSGFGLTPVGLPSFRGCSYAIYCSNNYSVNKG